MLRLGRLRREARLGVVEITVGCAGGRPKRAVAGRRQRKDWGGVQPEYRAYCSGSEEGEPEKTRPDHESKVTRVGYQNKVSADLMTFLFLFFFSFFLHP